MISKSSESKLVSFVIPIFKTEKYLKNCLESAESISVEKVLAILRESFVFPIEVGPTTQTNKGFWSDIILSLPDY